MPVSVLEFQHVEARPVGAPGRGDELLHDGVHVLAGCRAGCHAPGVPGEGGRRDQRPPGVAEGDAPAVRPRGAGRGASSRVGELDAEAGVRLSADEVGDPAPGRFLLVGVQTRAPRRGPSVGADGCHAGDDESRAAQRLRAQVDQFEVGGHTVLRGVQRGGRYDHTVAQAHTAQPERPEHRRRRVGLPAGRRAVLVPGVHRVGERLVAHAEVVVGDPSAAGEQVERELVRLLTGVTADVLEPFEARLCGPLRGFDDRPALGFVCGERTGHVRMLVEAGCQGEGVLHGELGAGADGEVRGVGGVAEQHDVLVAPRRVPHGGEADPPGTVGYQPVAVEVVAEDLLAQPDAVLVVGSGRDVTRGEGVESRPPPGLLVDLDDEGAAFAVERVRVDLRGPEVPFLDDEGEGFEDLVGGEPHVTAVPFVQVRPEGAGVRGPGLRPYAVARHHEVVGGGEFGRGRGVRAVTHVHPECCTPFLEDLQQAFTAESGETVAARGQDPALVAHVDVAPAGEFRRHGRVDLRVGLRDSVEGLVGEHHPESEGVVGRVALPDSDLPLRRELLGQGREVQPAGPCADDCYAHGVLLVARGTTYAAIPTIVKKTR